MTNRKLIQAVDAYFTDLRLVRGSGGATDERSLYVPLANLLNDVGGSLRPKVFCVQELADQGAGHPDFNGRSGASFGDVQLAGWRVSGRRAAVRQEMAGRH